MRTVLATCLVAASLVACNDVPVAATPFSLKVTKTEANSKPIKVDFLWLVDNTPSMCQEQSQLADSLKEFLSKIEGFVALDYRIAFVTQDMLTPGSIGAFRAQKTTEFPYACAEKELQVCLREGQLDTPSDALNKVKPLCATPNCDCGNLGGDWKCDAQDSPKKVLNCNGTFNSSCQRLCTQDSECDATFIGEAEGAACAADPSKCVFKCLSPSDDKTQTGCVRRPDTASCPSTEDLRRLVIEGAGNVCDNGDSCDDATPCADGSACAPPPVPWLTRKTANDYIKCLGIVGAEQRITATLEQDLNAVLYSLSEAEGSPNREQAKRFLREDAYLVVVMVTDEDDCSMNRCGVDPKDGIWKCGHELRKEAYATCSCLQDARAGGKPEEALMPVASAINQIKALKSDPGRVLVAAIVGDSTATDPQQKAEERDAYRKSKCSQCTNPADKHPLLSYTYVCQAGGGKADYAGRIVEFVEAFGQNGILTNLCNDEGIKPALDTIANRIIRVFTKVCLPRPVASDENLVVQTIGPAGTCADGSACCRQTSQSCAAPEACGDGSACTPTLTSLEPGEVADTPTYQLTLSGDCASVSLDEATPSKNAVIFNSLLPPGTGIQIDYEADYEGRVSN